MGLNLKNISISMCKVKVSVIVPIYNVEKYLRQCVDSLLNQTLKEIEIILVDDGSTDECPLICEEYKRKDSRIKVVHKENGGLSSARNAGLDVAIGEYVAFIDSDDYVSLEMMEKRYSASKERNLDACYCDYNFDYDGKVWSANKQKNDSFVYTKGEVEDFLLDMVGPLPSYPSDVKHLVSVCLALYKTDIIKRYNIKFESERLYPSEDLLFHIDFLSRCSRLGYLKGSMYYWRYRPGSLSRSYSSERFKLYVALLNRVREKLEEHFVEDVYILHYQRCVYSFFRSIMKYESLISKESHVFRRIRERCSHPLIESVYESYPIEQMVLKHRMFITSMKHKLALPIYLMCWLENKIRKNV